MTIQEQYNTHLILLTVVGRRHTESCFYNLYYGFTSAIWRFHLFCVSLQCNITRGVSGLLRPCATTLYIIYNRKYKNSLPCILSLEHWCYTSFL